jgi:tight adherence protein B
MRAGHAFTTGMKFVAEEFDKPLGTEFQKTLDEINFGVDVGVALKRMASRIPSPELGVFVVSVILQRETGGNLSEILIQLGKIIRQRFTLQGKIVALTGEGRFTAFILFVIPIGIMLILYFMKPDAFLIMFQNPVGRLLSVSSIVSMVFGYLVIRRMLRLDI